MLNMGFYPFWFWNGVMRKDEIRRQIDLMAAAGVRGFFIHSRQGLSTPYLSERFMDMVETAVDHAQSLGMVANLYDEYPYPSGVAGGEVVLGRPEFYATRLWQQSCDIDGGPVRKELPAGAVLHCKAYPISGGCVDWSAGLDLRPCVGMILGDESTLQTGLSPYNRCRYFASGPRPVLDAQLPRGQHRLCMAVQVVVESHKYWGHFIDELNPKAIERFINCTHERYRRRFGGRFGKSVYSIFTDEVSPHWSQRIPDEFQNAYKYDLLEVLPALTEPTHPLHLKTCYDLDQLRGRLFEQAYEEQVSNWCRSNGIKYTGEKPVFRMSQLRYMDIPGCDAAHIKAGGGRPDLLKATARSNIRVAASAAYWYEKEGSLCESFHSLGWGATIQDARWLTDGMILLGIKCLVPHGAFYSAHSMRKYDAPPSFFFQMPWWPHMKLLTKRVERLAELIADSRPDARVLVYEPSSGLPDKGMRDAYANLLHSLMEAHVDFLMADTDVLESGAFDDGHIRVKDIRARVVVLPPMRLREPALEEWICAFRAAGGVVVACGSADDIAATVQSVVEAAGPAMRIAADSGNASDLWISTRVHGLRRSWMLLNTGASAIDVSLDAGAAMEECALDDGLMTRLRLVDGTTYRRTVEPFEGLWLQTAAVVSQTPADRHEVVIATDGEWSVKCVNANVLRMNEWRMSIGATGEAAERTVVRAGPISNQLEEAGRSFRPTVRRGAGSMPQLHLPTLEVEYEHTFLCDWRGSVHLVIEEDSIRGQWRLTVNDASPIGAGGLAPTDLHMHGCTGVDISSMLRQGPNVIRVLLTTDKQDGGLRSPLYLAGDFGVWRDGPDGLCRLGARPATGRFGAYLANGLPFYSGIVEYERDVTLQPPSGEHVMLRLDASEPFEDSCEISLNSAAFIPLPWSPRIAAIPGGTLRPGRNSVKLRVLTSRCRSFDGQYFDVQAHECRDVWQESPRPASPE